SEGSCSAYWTDDYRREFGRGADDGRSHGQRTVGRGCGGNIEAVGVVSERGAGGRQCFPGKSKIKSADYFAHHGKIVKAAATLEASTRVVMAADLVCCSRCETSFEQDCCCR